MTNLSDLRLQFNGLTGNIPYGIGNLENLATLTLYDNSLSGSIPAEMGQLYKLRDLFISANLLTGTIPEEICDLTNLTFFSIFDNRIEGEIPTCVNNLLFLKYFSVGKNLLEGSIPQEFCLLDSLTTLFVHDNDLSGCYSEGLNKLCTQLTNIWSPGNTGISSGNNFDTTWEDFCNTGAGSCGPIVSQVWPGDFDNNGTVEIEDLLYWGTAYNKTGVIRPNASINWVGQECEDWTNDVNGINSKHQDGNGNGMVDDADITALIQNLGQNHNSSFSSGLSSSINYNLKPHINTNVVNNDDITFEYDFFVEDENSTVSAHGISASIFFGGLNVVEAVVDISNSSLSPDEYLEDFDSQSNSLHFSLTKTDGINNNLDDAVCRVVVQVIENESGDSFALNLNAGSVMQANGSMQTVAGTTIYNANFENGTNVNNVLSSNNISINAVVNHANCESGGSVKINAYGGNGNYRYEWNTGETTQQIFNLSPGMYSVLVCDDNGVSNSIEVEVQGQFIPIYDGNGDIIPCNTYTCPTVVDFEAYVPDGTHQAKRAIHTNADLENGYNVELKAGNLIRLSSGFSTRGSQSFKVRIEDCE